MSAPSHAAAPGSDRVRLAEVAVQAAQSVIGVSGLDAGPGGLFITTSGATSVPGVRVVAEPHGRYSVELGLRARLVPLNALADAVRQRLQRAAAAAGLGAQLGAVSVSFFDVDPAEEAGA